MFSDDNSIDNLKGLFIEVKRYVELQKEYAELEIVEKLTKLISTLIMGIILISLGVMALFYLLSAFAYFIAPYVGLAAAYGIIVITILLIFAIIYIFRKKLIVDPTVNYLVNLFLKPNKKSKKNE